MTRIVYCCKLKQEAEGLLKAPFPGALGDRIYNEVSKQEMQKYFFGDGSEKPAGFTPNT